MFAFYPGQIVEERKGSEVIVRGDVVAQAGIPLRELNRREKVVLNTAKAQLAAVRLRPSLVIAEGKIGVAEAGESRAHVIDHIRADGPIVIDAYQTRRHHLEVIVCERGGIAERDQPGRRGTLFRGPVRVIEHAAQAVIAANRLINLETRGALIGQRTARAEQCCWP